MAHVISLHPDYAVSDNDFDLDAAIKNKERNIREDQVKPFSIYRCAQELRWSVSFLANEHSKSMALITGLAVHQGVITIYARDFIKVIDSAANRVFRISRDPEDRAWFEHGCFSLSFAGDKRLTTAVDKSDIELCGRLGAILGLKGYVINQLVLAAGLTYSSTLPTHTMNKLVDELRGFLEWGKQRARKAELELKRVEEDVAARTEESIRRKNWRYIFK